MTTDSFTDYKILKFLEEEGESKTRAIWVHLLEEYDDFSWSTLSRHLKKLNVKGFLEKRRDLDKDLDYWRITEAGLKEIEEIGRISHKREGS